MSDPAMIGIDLEKARAMIHHYHIENPADADTDCGLGDLVRQANLAEEALDEIERLTVEHQNALDEVKNLEEQKLLRKQENERLLEALDESEKIVAHKTKSAAHWYDEFLQARVDLVQTRRVIYQRDAKIKELEDALVEERANKMIQTDDCTQNQDAADFHHRCICEYNVKKCPVEKWWLDRARITLQAEGKIGSGDHIVETDQMIPNGKVWQITEERKAAIDQALTEKNAELMNGYLRRIKELKADLEQAERVIEARLEVIDQQATRIKELEAERAAWIKWLEEERANCIMAYEWQEDLPELDECADADRYRDEARQQLRAEGKIVNSNHSSDATKKVWKITEERKAAIDRGMRFLAWSNANTNDPETELDLVVLRAMLDEVE